MTTATARNKRGRRNKLPLPQSWDLPGFKALLQKRGYQPSPGSYDDGRLVCVFSVEDDGPATYYGPAAKATYNRETGWFSYQDPRALCSFYVGESNPKQCERRSTQ